MLALLGDYFSGNVVAIIEFSAQQKELFLENNSFDYTHYHTSHLILREE